MKTVGTFEARIHLAALLEQVERGREVIIIRHGKAVARLVPVADVSRERLEGTVARLKAFRQGPDRRSLDEGADRGRAPMTEFLLPGRARRSPHRRARP
jgi:prevent-host-death family protein